MQDIARIEFELLALLQPLLGARTCLRARARRGCRCLDHAFAGDRRRAIYNLNLAFAAFTALFAQTGAVHFAVVRSQFASRSGRRAGHAAGLAIFIQTADGSGGRGSRSIGYFGIAGRGSGCGRPVIGRRRNLRRSL